MKLQKIVLCVAVAFTSFGVGLGLFEIINYLKAAFQPAPSEAQTVRPVLVPTLVQQPLAAKNAEAPPERSGTEKAFDEDNKTGDYYLVGAKSPKGFEDFDWLEIVTHDWDEKTGKLLRVKPSGTLHAKQDFKIDRLGIKDEKISFITSIENKVNYHFEGKFVEEKLELYNDDGEEYAPGFRIKGRLVKWRDGVKTAEAQIELEVGGC